MSSIFAGLASSLLNSGAYKNVTAGNQQVINQGWNPSGLGSGRYDIGMQQIYDWAKANPDNKSIGAAASGAILSTGKTLANMGLALDYDDAQRASSAYHTSILENLRIGNMAKLMATEGGITKELMGHEGWINRLQTGSEGDQYRRNLRVAGEENRLGKKVQGDQDRRGTRVSGDELRATRRTEGEQDRLGYMAKGIQNRLQSKVQGAQDRLLERTRGDETRQTQREKYMEERNMRADARGAITRSGASFFG